MYAAVGYGGPSTDLGVPGGYCTSGAQIHQVGILTASALCGVWGIAPAAELLSPGPEPS